VTQEEALCAGRAVLPSHISSNTPHFFPESPVLGLTEEAGKEKVKEVSQRSGNAK